MIISARIVTMLLFVKMLHVKRSKQYIKQPTKKCFTQNVRKSVYKIISTNIFILTISGFRKYESDIGN